MVIIGNKSGQLGNRLFVFAHFIANAIEFGYAVSNPSFHDYAHYFANLREDFFCRFPRQASARRGSPFLQGAFFMVLKTLLTLCAKCGFFGSRFGVLSITQTDDADQQYDLSQGQYRTARESCKFLMVKGWLFRDPINLKKHADQVRDFFVPAPHHAQNISKLMAKARPGCDLLIGIHIRQGDYQNWLGGKHFYSSQQYVDVMHAIIKAFAGKKVRFLVCSNVVQDERLFDGLDFVFGNNHQLEDMYAFACCDYLVGPPSTYTMWASFYGSVPLYIVNSLVDPIRPDGFRVCEG